jgi:2,3-bisphosphoglycerate-independent phosphoglycerate mutase
LHQFRCAETEKYAHVTYFFNGGREEPFHGEDRKMVPSPRDVATYDEKPAMSASLVADAVVAAVDSATYDFILVNFANPDMVGHTGNLAAAIEAVDAVDAGLARITKAIVANGGALVVTADHGNCELMKDPATGEPHTSHTTNRVPLIYVDEAARASGLRLHLREGGRICDVAPTLLAILGVAQPKAMTGRSLLEDA